MRSFSNLLMLPVLALFVGWFGWLRPSVWGGPTAYIMVTGHSMEPTFFTGDLVIVRRASTYVPGDVIAYRVKRGNIIHRIVGVTQSGSFVMLGDNNQVPDPWQPTYDEILGKQWLFVPRAGRYLAYLRQPRSMAMIAGLALLWVFGDAILGPATSAGRKRQLLQQRRRRLQMTR